MSESDSSMSTSKMITLKSSDGTLFLVPETVAKQSKTISHIIEDIGTDAITSIPLPNVRSPTLAMVIHYCNKHVQFQFQAAAAAAAESSKELRDWDMQFLDHVDKDTLYDLIMAADYLHIQGLLDAACQKVADMITGKNPEMIRHIFNIKNDFTPKEEEEIRCENLWAFQ